MANIRLYVQNEFLPNTILYTNRCVCKKADTDDDHSHSGGIHQRDRFFASGEEMEGNPDKQAAISMICERYDDGWIDGANIWSTSLMVWSGGRTTRQEVEVSRTLMITTWHFFNRRCSSTIYTYIEPGTYHLSIIHTGIQ